MKITANFLPPGRLFFCKYFHGFLPDLSALKLSPSLFFLSLFFLFIDANAQISEGGKPLTMRLFGVNNLDSALQVNPNTSSINDLSKIQLRNIKVPQVELTSPDLTSIIKEDQIKDKKDGLFREGVTVSTDISPENSGKWTILDDGEKIWRLKIQLPGAKAIGLYYDHFYLPQGAKYFLFNENGRQVLGAYTYNNNPDDDIWANEKVQGDLINLEIDLPANVDTSSVHLHINNAADFYRATEYLNRYKSPGAIDMERSTLGFPYDESSPCEINAICPLGASFPDQRRATVMFEYLFEGGVGEATGTLINNTSQNCVPLLLTASHTELTNSTSNTTFSNWIFYFNYETPTCSYSGADSAVFSSQTMTGATFKARASYNSSTGIFAGDFLLLQLKSNIPLTYNACFSGWDNTGNTPADTSIGFHHPYGDVKKLAITNSVISDGSNLGGEANAFWEVFWTNGGEEDGSSGSGLFDSKGHLIGDLSEGASDAPSCTAPNIAGDEINNLTLYSKLSLNWLYTYQQPSTPQTRLKDWLDPGNTGDSTLDAIANTSACIASATGILTPPSQPAISVNVYPNPAKGNLFADVYLNKVSDLRIELYNMVGLKVYELDVPGALSRKYNLDLNDKPSGTYLVRISTGDISITEKIISLN